MELETREDLEDLMESGFDVAIEMLQDAREFHPYAAIMLSSGEIQSMSFYDGRENPPSADVIKGLKAQHRDGASDGSYRATALYYDVRTTDEQSGRISDAIAVDLDHVDGTSITVLHPYEIKGRKVEVGEVSAIAGAETIFSAPDQRTSK